MRAQYDVLGVGNAIMDVIGLIGDDVLERENIAKGSMTLINQKRALHLHSAFKQSSTELNENAGGSGANTVAGTAALGVRAAYIGKVADDELGRRFTQSMGTLGVTTPTKPLKQGAATARSLIAVTPDGERSMSTYLGANTAFGVNDIHVDTVRASDVIYLEGYLFDTEDQKAAFIKAAEIATNANRKVALTLSDSFCADRHRAAFKHLVDNHVDILFANETEILSLYETNTLSDALSAVWTAGNDARQTTILVTRSEKGSLIKNVENVYEVQPLAVDKVIDTTGAGDQYAAGVLAGRAMGMNWPDAGRLGSLCASEVISHYGARPQANIHGLIVDGVARL